MSDQVAVTLVSRMMEAYKKTFSLPMEKIFLFKRTEELVEERSSNLYNTLSLGSMYLTE